MQDFGGHGPSRAAATTEHLVVGSGTATGAAPRRLRPPSARADAALPGRRRALAELPRASRASWRLARVRRRRVRARLDRSLDELDDGDELAHEKRHSPRATARASVIASYSATRPCLAITSSSCCARWRCGNRREDHPVRRGGFGAEVDMVSSASTGCVEVERA
jgi:hypothetical protein